MGKVMYGVNERRAVSGSPWDAGCSIVSRDSEYTRLFGAATQQEGCHPSNSSVSSRSAKREATRVDFEWTLGDPLLRSGWDQDRSEARRVGQEWVTTGRARGASF